MRLIDPRSHISRRGLITGGAALTAYAGLAKADNSRLLTHHAAGGAPPSGAIFRAVTQLTPPSGGGTYNPTFSVGAASSTALVIVCGTNGAGVSANLVASGNVLTFATAGFDGSQTIVFGFALLGAGDIASPQLNFTNESDTPYVCAVYDGVTTAALTGGASSGFVASTTTPVALSSWTPGGSAKGVAGFGLQYGTSGGAGGPIVVSGYVTRMNDLQSSVNPFFATTLIDAVPAIGTAINVGVFNPGNTLQSVTQLVIS